VSLQWDVFVTPGIPTAVADRPPDLDRRMWSPITSTLIYGETDAVLVDAFMTTAQAKSLADWVAEHERQLTTIYITHGHGDHWFGIATLLQRFPEARAVATPKVVAHMRAQGDPDFVESFWNPRFPGEIPERIVAAEELDGDSLGLEGKELSVVDLGHTDTDDTTCLYAPDIGLVVAGDAVYNNVHLYLAESPHEKRRQWLAALDTIDALAPRTVIAGHKDPARPDGPGDVAETRRYIQDFEEEAARTSTTLELYRAMLRKHSDRVNPGALWGSARATKNH
jgi:glyoxylase-like metal-dependent hydrolase (beta-lactamase superfamily II)